MYDFDEVKANYLKNSETSTRLYTFEGEFQSLTTNTISSLRHLPSPGSVGTDLRHCRPLTETKKPHSR